MVKEMKGEKIETGILYFPDFLYKMNRAGKAGEFSWLARKVKSCLVRE